MTDLPVGTLEASLRASRDAGRKLLVPYITGGLEPDWADAVRAAAAAGADAIEIGIPFSDPVMDGPVIQLASERALEAGATPSSVLDALRAIDAGVPVAVMTYYNICFRMGHERFARSLVESNVCAAILPDLPLEEVEPWAEVSVDGAVLRCRLAGGADALIKMAARYTVDSIVVQEPDGSTIGASRENAFTNVFATRRAALRCPALNAGWPQQTCFAGNSTA